MAKHGKKIYADGRIYVGELENEIENGKGLINNTTYGVFKNGVLIEEVVEKKVVYHDDDGTEQIVLSHTLSKVNDE